MQLTKFYVEKYKILNDFSIDVDQPVSVFIGINGSGKSSFLEALAWVFSSAYFSFVKGKGSLDKRRVTNFNFRISYIIKISKVNQVTTTTGDFETHYVEVTLEGDSKIQDFYKLTTNNSQYSTDELIEKFGFESLFPERINVYYSGITEIMHTICNEHLIDFKNELRSAYGNKAGNVYITPRLPFYYFEPKHFPMMLAGLFAYEYNFSLDSFFSKHLNLAKPKKSTIGIFIKKRQFRIKESHINFWGAEGELRRFLGILQENAINKGNYDEEKEQYQFLFDLDNWYAIKDEIGDEKRVFELLYLLDVSELLDYINVFCSIDKIDISHEQISEGQKQKIIIRAFYELLQLENSLFILDEPDTFLHPQWQDDFIMEISGYAELCTYLITTHSSILISNLKDGNLFTMSSGIVEKVTNNYYGKEYSDNLQDFMHTPPRNEEFQTKLNTLFKLIDDEQYSLADENVAILEKDLGEDDPEILRAKTLISFYNTKE